MKNKLIFNAQSTEAWIEFASGAESCPWQTKQDALRDINDCFLKKKISLEEFEIFTKQILESKLAAAEQKRPSIEQRLESLLTFLVEKFHELVPGKRCLGRLPLENLNFLICSSCENPQPHGYIENDNVMIGIRVDYKIEGYTLVEALYEEGIISYSNNLTLKKEIAATNLMEAPVDPQKN